MRHQYNKIKLYLPLVLTALSLIVLIIGNLLAFKGFWETRQKVITVQQEVNDYKQNINNASLKSLTEDQINGYTQLMTRLVPDSEDYFSILASLEQLSKNTNFSVTQYSIDVSNPKSNMVSITVQGVGNMDSFLQLLNNYQFKGGRFVTADRIDFSEKERESTKFILTFYSNPVNTATQPKKTLTAKDIAMLEEIKNKVTFTMKDEQTNKVEIEYPVKSNPF